MLSIFKIYFSFFLFLSINLFLLSLYFLILDMVIYFELSVLSFNSVSILMPILLDWMSLSFMSFVLFISALVVNYSGGYMQGDGSPGRFILLVVMFVVSMLMLVISPNLVSILLGWDGLGLTSYALVIYYQNMKSFNAGMLTALSNRLGDVAILMGIAWMLSVGSWNFVFHFTSPSLQGHSVFITYFVVLAAITKSAQIPFSPWLPAAMAAPTPVSSLVHSSTLVTAGVYLLIRFNYAFSPHLMNFLLFISLITMFMAGLGASMEYDLKKIIALSTLSQLGLMISILALGGFELAFFHLLIHALFKALLFLCAGMMIHNLGDCQDIRFMGGLTKFMPVTCLLFNICNLSLCGLPFLSGFYSKDLMAEAISMEFLNLFVYMVFFTSVGLTAFYSFRLTYYSLTGGVTAQPLISLGEDKSMLKSMGWLVLLVICMGSVMMWVLFPVPYFICLPFHMKMLTLFFIFSGIWLGHEGAKPRLSYFPNSLKYLKWSMFLSGMWNLPLLSTFGLNRDFLQGGSIYLKIFDQGWFEYYGPQKLFTLLKSTSRFMQALSSLHYKIFLVFLLVWVAFLIILFFYLAI